MTRRERISADLKCHPWAVILVALIAVVGQRGARPAPPIAAEIHGQVRYAGGNTPAEQVLVHLERFGGGLVGQVMTDRGGKFRFSGLAQMQYVVTVRASGYREIQQRVDLQTATSDYLQLQLVPERANAPAAAGTIDASVPAAAREEYARGQAALEEGRKTDEAVRHLEKAVSLAPSFLAAQLLLGTAYMDAHEWEKAERALGRARAIDAHAAPAHLALGEVYRQRKRYAEAEKSLAAGLELDPRSWQGHYTLGRVYFEQGEMAKAGPEVGRALQLKPDFAEARLLAGNILLRARQPEHALEMFEDYLRLEPNGPFAAETRELIEKLKRALAAKKP